MILVVVQHQSPCCHGYPSQHLTSALLLLYRWVKVGEEVMEAAQAGLPGLSEQEVQAQLCFALLRSARFTLAKTYLTGTLPSRPLCCCHAAACFLVFGPVPAH